MNKQAVARALFSAFMSGDDDSARSLCEANLQACQNGGPPMTLDKLLGFAKTVRDITKNFRYENIDCSETASGFVEEHDVCATLPDGSEFSMPACIVATIIDGKITHLNEYFDTGSAVKLAKALATVG